MLYVLLFDVFLYHLVDVPYGLKYNYRCDATEKQNETLEDAINECESTANCEKVLDEKCDNQGPFMLCTEESLDNPSPILSSCIYIRNYFPGMNKSPKNIKCQFDQLYQCTS